MYFNDHNPTTRPTNGGDDLCEDLSDVRDESDKERPDGGGAGERSEDGKDIAGKLGK